MKNGKPEDWAILDSLLEYLKEAMNPHEGDGSAVKWGKMLIKGGVLAAGAGRALVVWGGI